MSRRSIAEAVLIAGWLGAVLLFAAVVAPAAFAVLPSRTLAGSLVGRVLPVLFVAGMVVGAVVAVGGMTGRRSVARAAAGGVLVLACAISHLVIGGRIERLRAEIGPSLEALAPGDARRAAFGRLHAMSVAGLGVGVLAAAAALGMAAAHLRQDPRPG